MTEDETLPPELSLLVHLYQMWFILERVLNVAGPTGLLILRVRRVV